MLHSYSVTDKVRNITAQLKREAWSSSVDAVNFVKSLTSDPAATLEHTEDDDRRLTGMCWATGEQKLLLTRCGNVVIQDSVSLTES